METANHVSEAYRRLEYVLANMKKTEFVQIERISGDTTVSEVALRFVSEKDIFTKRIKSLLDDALEALQEGQHISITSTKD